jgi:hypothetical protein
MDSTFSLERPARFWIPAFKMGGPTMSSDTQRKAKQNGLQKNNEDAESRTERAVQFK